MVLPLIAFSLPLLLFFLFLTTPSSPFISFFLNPWSLYCFFPPRGVILSLISLRWICSFFGWVWFFYIYFSSAFVKMFSCVILHCLGFSVKLLLSGCSSLSGIFLFWIISLGGCLLKSRYRVSDQKQHIAWMFGLLSKLFFVNTLP